MSNKVKNFICTSDGFIKDIEQFFDQETCQMVSIIRHTDQLMYARIFSAKEAQSIMEKFNIHGFIYKPFKEIHIKTFVVKERVDIYDYFDNKNSKYKGFSVKKETFSLNDAEFLNNRLKTFTGDKFENIEDAEKHANDLNKIIIKNIKKCINDNKNMLNESVENN